MQPFRRSARRLLIQEEGIQCLHNSQVPTVDHRSDCPARCRPERCCAVVSTDALAKRDDVSVGVRFDGHGGDLRVRLRNPDQCLASRIGSDHLDLGQCA